MTVRAALLKLLLASAITSTSMLGVARAQEQTQEIVVEGKQQNAPSTLAIDHVVPLIAFDGLRTSKPGALSLDDRYLSFSAERDERRIAVRAIQTTAIETTTKALLRGTASTLASLAPNGAGQIYSAIRPGAAMLTIFYRDENHALHAVVLLVAKADRDTLTAHLTQLGLAPRTDAEPMLAGHDTNSGPRRRPHRRSDTAGAEPSAAPDADRTLRVSLPTSDGLLPPSFVAATYEALVAEASKNGRFATVWREGDKRDTAEGLALTLTVTQYRKGSAALRGAIPVAGMIVGKTLIRADLALVSAAGEPLLRREVKGSKRMIGESLEAGTSLAQRAIKIIETNRRS